MDQMDLAKRLGVTQAHVSLMEAGRRRVPPRLAPRLARLLDLPPTMLPVPAAPISQGRVTNDSLEAQLARLGYPGYAYRKRPGPMRHPMEVLLAALAFDDLEPRLVEALPWLLLRRDGFDVGKLVAEAKARDLQNRLGFVVALARQVAERVKEFETRLPELRRMESSLEPSRLAREEPFGQGRPHARLREWLGRERSDAAPHWNLLTDLKVEHLPYAG
ncbi:MAG: helix-turn-helix transcriptional regulator [Tepidiformaceae bacterium]